MPYIFVVIPNIKFMPDCYIRILFLYLSDGHTCYCELCVDFDKYFHVHNYYIENDYNGLPLSLLIIGLYVCRTICVGRHRKGFTTKTVQVTHPL